MQYHMQVSNASNTTGIPANGECSSASSYPSVPTGGVCRGKLEEILELANCDINEAPLVLSNGEVTASQAILGLNSLSPSPECREAVVPFLCLLLFGLCGSTSGLPLQPTSAECLDIRDRLCVAEWRLVAGLGLIDLPTCEDLPDEQVSCLASGDSMTNESDSTELEDTNTTDFTGITDNTRPHVSLGFSVYIAPRSSVKGLKGGREGIHSKPPPPPPPLLYVANVAFHLRIKVRIQWNPSIVATIGE